MKNRSKAGLILMVNGLLEKVNKDIDTSTSKLAENYLHAFEWGHPATLYELHLKKADLTTLAKLILNKEKEVIEEALIYRIKAATEHIMRGGFKGRSTGEFSNIAHTMKFEHSLWMIETCTEILEVTRLTDEL